LGVVRFNKVQCLGRQEWRIMLVSGFVCGREFGRRLWGYGKELV